MNRTETRIEIWKLLRDLFEAGDDASLERVRDAADLMSHAVDESQSALICDMAFVQAKIEQARAMLEID